MASLWEVPAIFVCENNGYADFAAARRTRRSNGWPTARPRTDARRDVDGNDVEAVYDAARGRRRSAPGGRRSSNA